MKFMVWEACLPDPRVLKLHERGAPSIIPFGQGNSAQSAVRIQSPAAQFYGGGRIEVNDHLQVIEEIGARAFFNKYTRLNLYILPPVGFLGPHSTILIDGNMDTIVIEIKTNIPSQFLPRLDLSAIKHLAVDLRTSWSMMGPQLTLAERVTAVWDAATRFPNLKTLTVIIGSTGASKKTRNNEFQLVEINESFLEMEGRYILPGFFPNRQKHFFQTSEDAVAVRQMVIRKWIEIAEDYREEFARQTRANPRFHSLRMRKVDFKVAMVAWFTGSSIQPRDMSMVPLQPVRPRYYGFCFFAVVPITPVDIEKAIRAKSRHTLNSKRLGLSRRQDRMEVWIRR